MSVKYPWMGIKSIIWVALLGSLIFAACTAKGTPMPAKQVATASPVVHLTSTRVEPTRPAPTPTASRVVPPTYKPTQIPENPTIPAPVTTSASPYPGPQTIPPTATTIGGAYPAPAIETATPIPTATETVVAVPTETPAPTFPAIITPGEGTDLAPGGWQPSSGAYPAPGAEATSIPADSPTPVPTTEPINPTATVGVTLTGAPSPATATSQTFSPYPGPAVTPSPPLPASPTAINTPGLAPTLTSPATSPGFPTSPTPATTGTVTLFPAAPQVVRVTQKVTDPTTVRLDSGQLQLVEFFAAWSNLSKSMAPVLNGLEAKYGGSIRFTYLDVDDKANSRFKQALGYQFPPHLFLLDGQGKVLKVWKGYVRVEELEEAFAANGVIP